MRCKELSLGVLRVMAHSLGLEADVFVSAHKNIGSEYGHIGGTQKSLDS